MKNTINFLMIASAILCMFFFSLFSNTLNAQNTKKNRVRLNVQYIKIMNGDIYFNIKASARIKKKTVKVSNIELTVFNELEKEKIELGKTLTNLDGESRFSLKNINKLKSDSTEIYHILVSFKGNELYKKTKKSIQFKNANIDVKTITKDSIHYIKAFLSDARSKEPIADESLTVYVQRLFKSLRIGKEFNNTNENGSILVPVEDGIPGMDGNLSFEIILNESDDYGTVKAIVKAPIGVPAVSESTFNQRTMWSPRSKTPIFLLIFPNLLIVSVWGVIIYLIINLFKLSKS